jgi:hypothetical protein
MSVPLRDVVRYEVSPYQLAEILESKTYAGHIGNLHVVQRSYRGTRATTEPPRLPSVCAPPLHQMSLSVTLPVFSSM